jgi:signal peptidase I
MAESDQLENSPIEPAPEGGTKAEPKPKLPARKRLIWTSFGSFLLFLLAVSVFFYYNFKTIEVQGNSMEPTLQQGQRLLISSAYWLVGEIKVNDIVVIKNTFEDDVIIKRVYKMGGETVDLAAVPENWDITRGKYVVPEGTIYVLGDNGAVSQDSRHYGPFNLSDVIGKVVVIQSTIGSSEESGA